MIASGGESGGELFFSRSSLFQCKIFTVCSSPPSDPDMAKSSSSRKSLKSLFSKSDLNLKESSEKEEKPRALRLFSWKKKKKRAADDPLTERTCSPGESEWPDLEQKSSLYATAPRSKKGLLSSSETDLHKPKRVSTFSLGWRRKKKNTTPLSQSFISINTDGEVKDPDKEQEDEDVEQASFPQQVSSEDLEPSLISTDQCQPLNVLSEDTEEGVGGYMPDSQISSSISFIDSDSDGYHTPPESPNLGSTSLGPAFTEVPAVTKSNSAASEALNGATLTTPHTTPEHPVAVLRTPALCPQDPRSGSELPDCVTKPSPSRGSSSAYRMKGDLLNISSAADSREHSPTLQNPEECKHSIETSVEAIALDLESNSESSTSSTSVSPHFPLSSSTHSPDEYISKQIIDITVRMDSKTKPEDVRDHSAAPPGATRDHTTPNIKHRPKVSASLGDVFSDTAPKYESLLSPVLPEITSTTEPSSFSRAEDVKSSSSSRADVPDSVFFSAAEPVFLDSETIQLQNESDTFPPAAASIRTSSTFLESPCTSTMDPVSSKQSFTTKYTHTDLIRQDVEDSDVSIGSSETVNKVSINVSAPDYLSPESSASHHTPLFGTELQEEDMKTHETLIQEAVTNESQINRDIQERTEDTVKLVLDEHEVLLGSGEKRGAGNLGDMVQVKYLSEEMLGSLHFSERQMEPKTEAERLLEAQDESGGEGEIRRRISFEASEESRLLFQQLDTKDPGKGSDLEQLVTSVGTEKCVEEVSDQHEVQLRVGKEEHLAGVKTPGSCPTSERRMEDKEMLFSRVVPHTLPLQSSSPPTDQLPISPELSYLSPSFCPDLQRRTKDKQISLEERKGPEIMFPTQGEAEEDPGSVTDNSQTVKSELPAGTRRTDAVNQVEYRCEETSGSCFTSETRREQETEAEAGSETESESESERERESLGGEVVWQLPYHLAFPKPESPVQRETEECSADTPLSVHEDLSITQHTHLGARYGPTRSMPQGVGSGGRASLHAEREGNTTQEQVSLSESSRASGEENFPLLRVGAGGEDSSGTHSEDIYTLGSVLSETNTPEKNYSGDKCSGRRSTERGAAAGVIVYIREFRPREEEEDLTTCSISPSLSDHRPDPNLSLSFSDHRPDPNLSLSFSDHRPDPNLSLSFSDHRPDPNLSLSFSDHQPDPNLSPSFSVQRPTPSFSPSQRFSHVLPVLSTVEEEPEAESCAEAGSWSDSEMSSGVRVLSTTFTLRPRASVEDRGDGKRFHKVSLVSSNSSEMDSSENGLTYEGETRGASYETWETQRENFRSYNPSVAGSEIRSGHSVYASSSEPHTHPSSSSFSSESPPSSVSMDTTDNFTWGNLRSEVREEESGWSVEELPTPGRERERGITNTGSGSHALESDGFLSGVFKATRVELPSSPTEPEPEPEPDSESDPSMPTSPHDMDTLLDTLKSMGPPVRHRPVRNSGIQFSSLPPIVEDASILSSAPVSSPTSPVPKDSFTSLPPDLGLNWSTMKDMRSPLAMLKEQHGLDLPGRSLILPSRVSSIGSLLNRKGSLPELSQDDSPQVNFGSSRLDHSLLFSSYRSEENGKAYEPRSLFRAASLPEVSSGFERISVPPKALDAFNPGTSRLERLSFLTSPPGSLSGLTDSPRVSVSPLSPTFNHTAPQNLDLYQAPAESPFRHPAPPSLQRSLSGGSNDGSPIYNDIHRGFGPELVPERHYTKYRAFPDAYLTKEKEHGKLNPRPGKMYIYDRPGFCGQRIELRGDVVDATAWKFPERISIRVVRGGWVLYEKPDFKGEKIALDEGDMELTNPFIFTQNQQNGTPNGTEGGTENGKQEPGENHTEPEPRRFIIGSLRRAVRDYSVPEICLFPEENAEGKKVVFRDTSEDARIFGFPIKANSIIINAGLWLVFAEPFFQGVPRVLEVGGFTNPASWGVTQPYVGSLHPLKIGEPRVEKPNDPKLVIYEKPYFTGKSREIYTNTRDFMTREDRAQTVFMFNAGSIKVLGGIWVGYEKEGFRGNQYLLEEGEYHDWRVWGGRDSELRSARVIRTDLSQPVLVMIEMPGGDEEGEEERTFEVTEAVPDVEPFGFKTMTRSIHVLSGAWVAYSHVDYSGNQFVLEKGYYSNCADWGSEDNRICSIQPILQAPMDGPGFRSELQFYSEPSFQGICRVFTKSHEGLPEGIQAQSCRVTGGSWALYDDNNFLGNQYVLSEGDYANVPSMGCPPNFTLHSIKSLPMEFTVPSISLFGLECFEGREVTVDMEISNMTQEGYNPHFLSVRVNRGCWVLCEHSNYRGRQFLLEPIEITNWHKFSSFSTVGSMYPIRVKRRYFRIRYKETGLYMSVQGGVESMKSGRIVVSQEIEGDSDLWFYQDGLLKNKLSQCMSVQVMGTVESGAKVVLWSETRSPVQMWSAQLNGTIYSITFPGLLLDVKGGKAYDKDHVIIRSESEEDSCLWELELL
ncbi:beta/gamma crystallin domain-containing protein 1 [Hoplias malabaricus]|uniref:beta/gamma crystallin domain-containing protein 1 n=1 Tax=Hoplias malabaricus TaxID=27720 RepID=UPI003463282F